MRYHLIYILSLISAAAVPLVCHAKPISQHWDSMQRKHSRNTVPEHWESLGHPPAGATIKLCIALKPDRETALNDAVYEVSDPGHPKYGAHLSKDQVAELVAPHPHILELVHSWLDHHGIPLSSISTTHGGNTLTLTGVSMTQADELLNASYQVYRHVKTNETIVRTIGYSLPASLHAHVWTVGPTTHFDSPRVREQTPQKLSGGETGELAKAASGEPVTVLPGRDDDDDPDVTTPTFLRYLYNTWSYVPAARFRNTLAVAGFLEDYPSFRDLALFMQKYRTDGTDATYSAVLINYGNLKYDPSTGHGLGEANLDLQYAQGMAYPTPIVFYSVGLAGDGWQDWLNSVINLPRLPQTISISYGSEENIYVEEDTDYICSLFGQLAARGVSVLTSTGNKGVGRDCIANDGSIRFTPNFPATCPWVTAVGGTTSFLPEVAADISTGGFSDHFPRPLYQLLAAYDYLQGLGNRYQGLFNNFGRGIPDISAQAKGFRSFNNSIEISGEGTSGATPVVAGIISLLNDYLLSKGKAPLGFLNPWLYSLSIRGLPGFNDITIGSNPGCGTTGFRAAPGWDPVTGLGTPDFEVLRQILEFELPWRMDLPS